MTNVNRFAPAVKASKQKAKTKKEQAEADGVGWLVRVPLYCAAGGLFVVYSWGSLETLPTAAALSLCAVFAMSELLKPKLGELAAEALVARDTLGSWLMLGSSLACIALGALGGVIAMGAANGPREAYEATVGRLDAAQGRLNEAQARLDSVPTCTPDMPRVRCIAQTEQNAAALADRTLTRDEAKQERDAAEAQLRSLPDPGPGMPAVALWQKALVIAAVEFVLFAVPFCARRRQRLDKKASQPQPQMRAAPKLVPVALKVNDGGWERRRELYGPTGRKPRKRFSLGSAS